MLFPPGAKHGTPAHQPTQTLTMGPHTFWHPWSVCPPAQSVGPAVPTASAPGKPSSHASSQSPPRCAHSLLALMHQICSPHHISPPSPPALVPPLLLPSLPSHGSFRPQPFCLSTWACLSTLSTYETPYDNVSFPHSVHIPTHSSLTNPSPPPRLGRYYRRLYLRYRTKPEFRLFLPFPVSHGGGGPAHFPSIFVELPSTPAPRPRTCTDYAMKPHTTPTQLASTGTSTLLWRPQLSPVSAAEPARPG